MSGKGGAHETSSSGPCSTTAAASSTSTSTSTSSSASASAGSASNVGADSGDAIAALGRIMGHAAEWASTRDGEMSGHMKGLMALLPTPKVKSNVKANDAVENCIEDLKLIIEGYGKKSWVGKLWRKKKPKKVHAETLKDSILALQKLLFAAQLISLVQSQDASEKKQDRTVLWVDDNPDNNTEEVKEATSKYKIKVIQKTSSKEAYLFLESNPQLKSVQSSQFRIVQDLYREDEGEDAGKNFLHKLRSEGWNTPILIYCRDPWKVIDLQGQHPNTLVATTQTQIYLYFAGMLETRIRPSSTKTGKKAKASSKSESSENSSESSSTDSEVTDVEVAETTKPKSPTKEITKPKSGSSDSIMSDSPCALPQNTPGSDKATKLPYQPELTIKPVKSTSPVDKAPTSEIQQQQTPVSSTPTHASPTPAPLPPQPPPPPPPPKFRVSNCTKDFPAGDCSGSITLECYEGTPPLSLENQIEVRITSKDHPEEAKFPARDSSGSTGGVVWTTCPAAQSSLKCWKLEYSALQITNKSGIYHTTILFQGTKIDKGSFDIRITPGKACAKESTISLPSGTIDYSSPIGFVAGETRHFEIKTRDRYQNKLTSGGCTIAITCDKAGADQKGGIYHKGTATDHQNGKYTFDLVLNISGLYSLNVLCTPQGGGLMLPVKSTPLQIMVHAGPVSSLSAKCVRVPIPPVCIGGTDSTGRPSVLPPVELRLCDRYGNTISPQPHMHKPRVCTVRGEIASYATSFSTELHPTDSSVMLIKDISISDGTVGECNLLVSIEAAISPPVSIPITLLPGRVHSQTSTAEGNIGSAIIGEVNTFTVVAKDRSRNRVTCGGSKIVVSLNGPNSIEGYVIDHNDGHYTVLFFPTRVGAYTCCVTLDSDPISNSPFTTLVDLPKDIGNAVLTIPSFKSTGDSLPNHQTAVTAVPTSVSSVTSSPTQSISTTKVETKLEEHSLPQKRKFSLSEEETPTNTKPAKGPKIDSSQFHPIAQSPLKKVQPRDSLPGNGDGNSDESLDSLICCTPKKQSDISTTQHSSPTAASKLDVKTATTSIPSKPSTLSKESKSCETDSGEETEPLVDDSIPKVSTKKPEPPAKTAAAFDPTKTLIDFNTVDPTLPMTSGTLEEEDESSISLFGSPVYNHTPGSFVDHPADPNTNIYDLPTLPTDTEDSDS
ncbi:hypothetical protein Pelo_16945 [Pelomyxa schiedti]|nr:hypothetical protein Pelo_16945 [Pelomyxa schiedti]